MWCCFVSSALSVLRGDKGNSSRLASKRRCLYGQWSGWIYATTSSPSSESYPYLVSWKQSGFFAEKLLDYLDDRDQDYLIKAKFKGLRLLLETKQWTRIKANHDWESTEFTHQCGTWSRARKFVAVRREKEIDAKDAETLFEMKEYDYFCYVLTDKLAPWQVHKQYGQRATSETWIEEAKNQSALAHIKTADFWANSALFQAAILAYNTLRWMVLCSGNKILRRWEAATIRTFLIRMAGKWTTGSRQQKLRVPKRMLYNAQWEAWVAVEET